MQILESREMLLAQEISQRMLLACLLVKTRVCVSLFELGVFILNDSLAFHAIGKRALPCC